MITKRGRITKRRSKSNMVKLKFGVKSVQVLAPFRVAPYLREEGKDRVLLSTNFSFNILPIFTKLGRAYHGNTGGDLRWLAPSPLDSFRQNGLT